MLKETDKTAWAKHKNLLIYIIVQSLPGIKPTDDNIVGWVDQPMISLKLHLTDLCKTGNAALETVQI